MSLRHWTLKKYILIIFLFLLVTDAAIFFNIPFIRQTFGFLFFTIIPGLLILHIFRLNKLTFIKKFVVSVGLSVAFLMLSGLLLNCVYPVVAKPLSFYPILLVLNIFTLLLALFAYLRNKRDFSINEVINIKYGGENRLLSPLLFAIIFPLMSILGTHLMNIKGNNTILITMLCLIPVYIIIIVVLKDRISEATYPIALLSIGMALILMYGLRGNNVLIGDVSIETYTYHLVLAAGRWIPSGFYDNYNACLPVTILPTIYHYVLNMDIYIYKLIYQLFQD